MLTDTKILRRLMTLLAVMLVLMTSLAGLGLWGMSDVREKLRSVYVDRAEPLAQISVVMDAYYKVRITTLNAINSGDSAGAAAKIEENKAALAPVSELWKAYLATELTPEEDVLSKETSVAMADYDTARGEVMSALASGDVEGARELAKTKGSPAFSILIGKLFALSKLQQEVAGQVYEQASSNFSMLRLVLLTLFATAVAGGGWFALRIARSITDPLDSIIGVMGQLTNGNLKADVTGTERGDEVGDVSRAVSKFKDGLVEAEALRGQQEKSRIRAEEVERERLAEQEKARVEQEEARVRSEAERRQAMLDLASKFEASVGGVVGAVTSAATQLQSTAQSLAATAEEATAQSSAAEAGASQATQNVHTVAAATEELSASIREISSQVIESSKIVAEAVAQANDTNGKVRELSDAAKRIGEVVTLISDIAEQTNLLALNATIEAARAGEAGRGFAVVASEVKNLADQTSKATGEIASQVQGIQSATSNSADSIAAITRTIERVNEISTAIASAIEEQGMATQEISRNVQEASQGTSEVSSNMMGVTQASQDTSAGSQEVLNAARELAENGSRLRLEVDQFLRTVRAG